MSGDSGDSVSSVDLLSHQTQGIWRETKCRPRKNKDLESDSNTDELGNDPQHRPRNPKKKWALKRSIGTAKGKS